MSFVRFNPEDFVVSTDSVTTTLWSNFTPTLTTFFTSSTGVGGTTTGSAGYINVYQSNPAVTASAEIQFSLAYGRVDSSGSAPYNLLVPQNTPTRVTYGQYRTLVNGDENTNFNFGQNNTSSVDLYVINIERARYKDHLFSTPKNSALEGILVYSVPLLSNTLVIPNTFFSGKNNS